MSLQLEREDAENYRRRHFLSPRDLIERLVRSLFFTFGLYGFLSILFFYDFWFINGKFIDQEGWFPDPPKSKDFLILLFYWLKIWFCVISCGIMFLSCWTSYTSWEAIRRFFSKWILILILALTAIAAATYYLKYLT
jgi:magnesium-transporting ATPase (P-type)